MPGRILAIGSDLNDVDLRQFISDYFRSKGHILPKYHSRLAATSGVPETKWLPVIRVLDETVRFLKTNGEVFNKEGV